jgi:hypothetical protein
VVLYSVFTDEVKATVTSQHPVETAIILVTICYSFYGATVHSYRENLIALGGELCSFSREPASDSCVQLYQRKHWLLSTIRETYSVHYQDEDKSDILATTHSYASLLFSKNWAKNHQSPG